MTHTDLSKTSGSSPTTAPPKCPVTQKKSFPSESDAIAFEERNRTEYNTLRQFPYACEECSVWHLTATPPGTHSIAKVDYSSEVNSTKQGGRRKGIDTAEVVQMKQSGMSLQEIADKLEVTVAAVHYHLKKKEDKPQLVTYEHHRDRRLELETRLAEMKRDHAAEEQALQEEISRVKQIEDRLFEQRQLHIGYGSDGAVILKKNGRELDLSLEDIRKLLAEVEVPSVAKPELVAA